MKEIQNKMLMNLHYEIFFFKKIYLMLSSLKQKSCYIALD